jgi:hypothetical protein
MRIHNPDPWCKLKQKEKVEYAKIKAWYTENEHAVRPKARELKASEPKRRRYKMVPANYLNADFSLDTAEVSKRVEDMLRLHMIDIDCFMRHIINLRVSKAKSSQLFYQPNEWASLSKTDKLMYVKMQVWSLATEEDIVAMKKNMTKRMKLYKASRAPRQYNAIRQR